MNKSIFQIPNKVFYHLNTNEIVFIRSTRIDKTISDENKIKFLKCSFLAIGKQPGSYNPSYYCAEIQMNDENFYYFVSESFDDLSSSLVDMINTVTKIYLEN
jgi:hypothetical protein